MKNLKNLLEKFCKIHPGIVVVVAFKAFKTKRQIHFNLK